MDTNLYKYLSLFGRIQRLTCIYLDQSGSIHTYNVLNSRPVLNLVVFSTKTIRPYAEIINSQGIQSSGMLHSVDWELAKFRNNLSNLQVSSVDPSRWYSCTSVTSY